MKGTKYLTIILSLILVTVLLFTGCGKKEETVTAITSEQFTTLYENAKSIYAETPELFAEDAEKPSIDLDSVTDSEIPVSEAITLNEVLQTLGEENLSNESFDKELDEAITKAESIDLIIKAYEAIAKRDGYATNQQDGLNEGSVVDRGDQSEVSNGEYNGSGEDVEVEGEIVEGTTLTKEEIDELKANATSSGDQYSLTLYEEVTKNGTYTDEYGRTFNKVVGKPDGSWRRMTDAEAQAIIAQGKDAEGYYAAEAELESSSSIWCYINNDTVYYDYYAWLENAKANPIPKKEVKFEEVTEEEREFWSSVD